MVSVLALMLEKHLVIVGESISDSVRDRIGIALGIG